MHVIECYASFNSEHFEQVTNNQWRCTKLIVTQIVKKFLTLYGNRRLINVFSNC
jgi:hypothetical protein